MRPRECQTPPRARASVRGWLTGAALVVGGLCLLYPGASSEARGWHAAARLEAAGRSLLEGLHTARSDLERLGPSADWLATRTASGRAVSVRHLERFLASRHWSHSLLVAPAGGPPLLVQRHPGEMRCDLGHAESTGGLPPGEGFLGLATPANKPRLCMGVAVADEDGRRVAIVAEIDPGALLGHLESAGPEGLTPVVTDSGGRTILGTATPAVVAERGGLLVGLPGWRGPAAGTWRLSAPDMPGAPPRVRWPRVGRVASLLLGLSLTPVLLGARIETRRPPARGTHAWRALVAEDNPVSQRVIGEHLGRLGGTVDVVANGREAVEAMAARHYDIVFMDWRMPEVDGLTATREIRRHEPAGQHTPIVAVTANTLPQDRERCFEAGMDDFLAKPVFSEDLRGAIERHLRGQSGPGAERPLPPAAPVSPVDVGALERLKEIDADSAPGFLAALTRDLEQGFRERLAEMNEAVRTGDNALMESAAHSLKGSAALVGAEVLRELCGRLEQLARASAAGEGAELVASLAPAHASVHAVLAAAVASLSPDRHPPAPTPGSAPLL